jgi:predicted DNA-binding transcriptional regulator AlpA
LRFIERNFIPLNAMMERAGMSERDIYDRTRDVFQYFNLPYDAPPPEE